MAGLKIDIIRAYTVFGDGFEFLGLIKHTLIDRVNAQNEAGTVGDFFTHLLLSENAACVVAHNCQSLSR